MKITRIQLRKLINEALEMHVVEDNIESIDSHEAYGQGYLKGKELYDRDHLDRNSACVKNEPEHITDNDGMGRSSKMSAEDLVRLIRSVLRM